MSRPIVGMSSPVRRRQRLRLGWPLGCCQAVAMGAWRAGRGAGAVTDRPNKNVARGEATRAQLIAIGTRLFAARGYEGTSVEAVLQEAGVSRGSLYHHFSSKEALFEAVLEDIEARVGAQTLQ